MDKTNPTQFGRAMAQLGIDMIPAYSPEARGRSERVFRTHQDRLVRELAAASIDDMAAANPYLQERYLPAYNAEFTQPPREPGSAFVVRRDRGILDDMLCVQFEGMRLQIPAVRHRCHYIKVQVKVLRHTDGTLSIHYGPRVLARYSAEGKELTEDMSVAA